MTPSPTQIPGALRRARAALEADGAPDPVTPTPAPTPASAPAPTPQTGAPSDPEAAFRVEPGQSTDDRLDSAVAAASDSAPVDLSMLPSDDQRTRTLKGMLKKRTADLTEKNRQVDRLTDTVASLTERLTRLEAAPAPTRAPAPSTPPSPVSAADDLTPEERERVKNSLPIVEKIARSIAAKMIAPLADRLAAFESTTSEIRGEVETTREQTYRERLYEAIPDLDDVFADEEFQAWIEETPTSQYTPSVKVRDTLADAHKNQNVQIIKRVIDSYRKHAGLTPVVRADPAQLQRPAGNGRSSSPPSTPTPVSAQLAWSKRVLAGEQLRRGKLTQPEFNRIKELYDRAMAEGRVDYNA